MLGAAMEVITQFPSLVRLDRCPYISGTNLKANLRSSRCDAIARDCRTVRGELLVPGGTFDSMRRDAGMALTDRCCLDFGFYGGGHLIRKA